MIAKYVTPWKFRREQQAQRVAALRQRDGDDCRRCRRPIRFDLTPGHDKGPKIEGDAVEEQALDQLFLCHARCNAAGADNTAEVTERVRRRGEAALFSRARAAG
jgi:5-methylcytosine-specific restriction endonuclease McrA